MTKRVLAVSIAALLGPGGTHRIWADPQPTFEVASVKLNNSADFRGAGWNFLPGGRFTAKNLPLFWVISIAYDVSPQSVRLSGGPNWIRSDRYDIEATAGAGALAASLSAKAREDKMRLMLQALLAERFKLAMGHDSKDLPVYAIVAGKGASRLAASKTQEKDCPDAAPEARCHIINGGMGRGMHSKAATVQDMASFVENWADRPVIDRTGIEGLFELDTEGWAPMRPRPLPPGAEPTAEDIAMSDPTRPTLSLIFERLGLKLEPQKAAADVYVIERVEKPSEN